MPLKQSKLVLKSEEERLIKLTELENKARQRGFRAIAGIDEAGIGPLAGPVVAAAVCISPNLLIPGINDSKLLSPIKRSRIFDYLISHRDITCTFAVVDVHEIDKINILRASLKAMRLAVEQMLAETQHQHPDYLLVDGSHLPETAIASESVIQGDRRSQSIAAASIVAKSVRDEIMKKYNREYPEYHFDQHKGYGTKLHQLTLNKFGPCPIHRRSFSPVAAALMHKMSEEA